MKMPADTGVGKSVSEWAKTGMPLPGAAKPKPGYTYLRGKQVPMPKNKIDFGKIRNCRARPDSKPTVP